MVVESLVKRESGAEKRQSEIESFLRNHNFELVSYQTHFGVIHLAVPNAQKGNLEKELGQKKFWNYLSRILRYHYNMRKADLNSMVDHGMCGAIATAAKVIIGYAGNSDYRVNGRISGEGKAKGTDVIEFYKDRRYRYHVLNYTRVSPDLTIAYDLTSHITMFDNRNQSQIFAIVGKTPNEIAQSLRYLTGNSVWDVGM